MAIIFIDENAPSTCFGTFSNCFTATFLEGVTAHSVREFVETVVARKAEGYEVSAVDLPGMVRLGYIVYRHDKDLNVETGWNITMRLSTFKRAPDDEQKLLNIIRPGSV
jgi:hypothetical protein